MLNLVQIQERLKDVPMQALMAYANGSNPQVPPFVALGELNRRKQMQESAAAEQAQQMEGAPTIKEQIEQQAGLIALQGNRQQQAGQMQQQQAARNPMLPAQGAAAVGEPVQMAGGGMVEDNPLLYRDYQQGGMVDPEMLKRMMMRRAMQGGVRGMGRMPVPAGGISSLVPRKYRGGGPVAFENGGSVFNRVDTSDTMRKKAEQYRAMLRSLLGGKRDTVDPADISQLLKEEPTEAPTVSDAFMREGQYPDEMTRGSRADLLRSDEPPPKKVPADQPTIDRPAAPKSGIAALNPAEIFAAPPKRSFDEILAENRRRREMLGIDEKYLDRYDERLGQLEAMDRERQAGQPMDQLTSFLAGIASSRRGAGFGEAGAAGVKASSQLRAEQQALNRKLAGEMASLRLLADEKRQALRTGQLDKVQAIEAEEAKLRSQAQKDQIDLMKTQEDLRLRGEQVDINRIMATRPTDYERQRAAYARHVKETGEKPTEAGFQRFMLGGRASTIMTMEDAIRLATQQLSAGAIEPPSLEAIQQRARELMILGGGQAPGAAQTNYLPMPSKKEELVSGKVYNTARGPARWDAQQQKFVPVR